MLGAQRSVGDLGALKPVLERGVALRQSIDGDGAPGDLGAEHKLIRLGLRIRKQLVQDL